MIGILSWKITKDSSVTKTDLLINILTIQLLDMTVLQKQVDHLKFLKSISPKKPGNMKSLLLLHMAQWLMSHHHLHNGVCYENDSEWIQ